MSTNLTTKQKLFIKAFEKHATNISRACTVVGIERSTHYSWLSRNATYKEKIVAIEESMIDFAEGMLYKNMKEGKESSILFFLKTRGKKRGYTEKTEIELTGDGLVNKIQIEFIEPS